MKQTILVTTDFSSSAHHALCYTCNLYHPEKYRIVLLHIHATPMMYTSEGVALTTIGEVFAQAEDKLLDETTWVHEHFPDFTIESRSILGGFVTTLKEQINEERPEMVVVGAPDVLSELWLWDNDLLNALRDLTAPVLLVPPHTRYAPVKNIGFACDYKNICVPRQVNAIRHLVQQTGSRLHIVHVSRTSIKNEEVKQRNEKLLKTSLQDVVPRYYEIEDEDVIGSIDYFVQAQNIDLLIVVPRKHDFWTNLFHKSHIRQLALLNHLPIMALPE